MKPMTVIIVTSESLAEILTDEILIPTEILFSCVEDLPEFEELIAHTKADIFVFDLDKVPLSDRQIAAIKKSHPEVELLVVSGRPYHPELRNSIEQHIFACLSKPLNSDEFGFCLKSIRERKKTVAWDSTKML